MGFSGDCICIKNDFSFERIENLKVGDILYNPYNNKGSKIKEIKEEYSENGYKIKTTNFFEINVSEDTLFNASSIIIDNNSDKYFLSTPTFVKAKDMNKVTFFLIPKIEQRKIEDFENLYLYSKALLKGVNSNVLILNNPKEKAITIENNSTNIKKIYLNKKTHSIDIEFYNNPFWLNDLNKKTSQRFINKKIFTISEEAFYNFLVGVMLENTDQFLNLNNFRMYSQSKMIVMQLFYLIIKNLNKFPNVEQIKKDIWSYEKIKQSNKRNIFAITCKDDIKKPYFSNGFYYQEIEYVEKNNRNIKYYKIITEDNEPFIVYNFIVN